ncbi:glutathione peroxidase [Photobacterium gaetbulicola]|uniref:Glutathione peroxidase n=1 Tax=Photobacterium gaetbulicola Gung47 TaxID=658445 RepID=A0A0C5WB55_9GAMM|nr:putative ABC transporter [Photobacterium gaetbulicola Gung47]PSU13389.1 glutathione peroxidase [Photobacterium gaetbulicola]
MRLRQISRELSVAKPHRLLVYAGLIATLLAGPAGVQSQPECESWLDQQFNKLNSTETVRLCEQFAGQVLLVVNTASQCGFTPQFEQLEAVYQDYKEQGFSVIGFPSNDFNQDRGSEENSAKVCYLDYGVTFPMLERTHIRGEKANPVFQHLAKQTGIQPKWNFYKYIIDRQGEVIAVFSSQTKPTDATMLNAIEKAL